MCNNWAEHLKERLRSADSRRLKLKGRYSIGIGISTIQHRKDII